MQMLNNNNKKYTIILCYATFPTTAKVNVVMWNPIHCMSRGVLFLLSNLLMNREDVVLLVVVTKPTVCSKTIK